jgi:hypothetical protein
VPSYLHSTESEVRIVTADGFCIAAIATQRQGQARPVASPSKSLDLWSAWVLPWFRVSPFPVASVRELSGMRQRTEVAASNCVQGGLTRSVATAPYSALHK